MENGELTICLDLILGLGRQVVAIGRRRQCSSGAAAGSPVVRWLTRVDHERWMLGLGFGLWRRGEECRGEWERVRWNEQNFTLHTHVLSKVHTLQWCNIRAYHMGGAWLILEMFFLKKRFTVMKERFTIIKERFTVI